MNPFSVLALLRVKNKIDICQDLQWEDVPLGVGNSHCDTTGNSAPQWEPLDLDGVNILTFSASSDLLCHDGGGKHCNGGRSSLAVLAASCLGLCSHWTQESPCSRVFLSQHRPPWPAQADATTPRGEKAGERRERGEIPPGNEREERGESAQHSHVLENGDTVTVAQPAPSLLVLCMRWSRLYKSASK